MGKSSGSRQIEIDQDPAFERRMAIAQRVSWAIMCLLSSGSCWVWQAQAPLVGPRQPSQPGRKLRVEYDRFWRHTRSSRLTFHFQPASPADGFARLWVDRDYLTHFILERIVPEPA